MCFPSFPCGKWYLQSDERLVWATTGQIRVNMKIKEQMEGIEFPDVLIHLRRFLWISGLAVRPEPETDGVRIG